MLRIPPSKDDHGSDVQPPPKDEMSGQKAHEAWGVSKNSSFVDEPKVKSLKQRVQTAGSFCRVRPDKSEGQEEASKGGELPLTNEELAERSQFEKYSERARLGDATAQYELGQCYHQGKGVEKSMADAAKYFKIAADNGQVDACRMMGWFYAEGKGGLPQSYKDSFHYFKQAADQGDPTSLDNVGLYYHLGRGVEQSDDKSIFYYKLAADRGMSLACLRMGRFYLREWKGVNQLNEEAFKYLKIAAEAGWREGQTLLGECYEEGIGVDSSDELALKYYKMAADQGYPSASHRLAIYYFNGWGGLKKSYGKAFKYFLHAAEHGIRESQYNLAILYERGFGGEASDELALKYYRLAADQQDPFACHKLGIFYANGQKGLSQSYQEALKYFKIAADHGLEENLPPGQARSYPFEAGGVPGRASAQRGGISSGGGAPLGAGIEGGAPAEAAGGFPPGRIGTEGGFFAPPGRGPGAPAPRPSFRYAAQPEGGITSQGYYEGIPVEEGPYGSIASQGRLAEIEMRPEFIPGELTSTPQWLRELPTGTVESSVFYDYPVQYRKAKTLVEFIHRFAISSRALESYRPEVVAALKSSRPLETSNSIMLYGRPSAIEEAVEYIQIKDTPIKQVFIEAIFLEVDLLDSLTLGVDWATSFGGSGTSGVQAFQFPPNLLGQALNVTNSILPSAFPFPSYAASVIGTHITHNGSHFSTFGAFVQAIHRNSRFHIFANPKIVTEPEVTCQVFNGTVDRYKTQSIPNDLGTLITNNYQYLEVGLMLQVTAFLNDDDTVVIQLNSERTAPIGIPLLNPATDNNDVNLEPVLTKDKTTTELAVPNGFIIAVSGILQDNELRGVTQIPCLGGIPIIGGLCKTKIDQQTKQNVILFLRPFIIETEEQLEEVTKRQQDVWCEKSKSNRSWNYEIAESLDQFNIKPTDPDIVNGAGCNQ